MSKLLSPLWMIHPSMRLRLVLYWWDLPYPNFNLTFKWWLGGLGFVFVECDLPRLRPMWCRFEFAISPWCLSYLHSLWCECGLVEHLFYTPILIELTWWPSFSTPLLPPLDEIGWTWSLKLSSISFVFEEFNYKSFFVDHNGVKGRLILIFWIYLQLLLLWAKWTWSLRT